MLTGWMGLGLLSVVTGLIGGVAEALGALLGPFTMYAFSYNNFVRRPWFFRRQSHTSCHLRWGAMELSARCVILLLKLCIFDNFTCIFMDTFDSGCLNNWQIIR